MTGVQTRKAISEAPYDTWFGPTYATYPADKETAEKVQPLLADVTVKVFMGTWCEDSQREVPAFFKALDLAGIDASKVQLITITEGKDAPEELIKDNGIEYVPTIIFEKEGKELGRIVEYSIFSIEKDMAKILNGEDYKHPYAEE